MRLVSEVRVDIVDEIRGSAARVHGGLVARLYAMTHPGAVHGMVLVDALSEALRAAQSPAEWAIQRSLLDGDLSAALKLYPAIERFDANRSFDQMLAAAGELKFELAARLRDEVQDLKRELRAMEKAGHA